MSLLNVCTSGVYIIGAVDGENANAMTASLVIPASFSPPCLTVAFDENRYTKDLLLKAGKFSVSVLSEKQAEIARRFGFVTGREQNKLLGFEGYSMKGGLPVIEDCSAWMICEVRSEMKLGDHVVIGGEVMRAEYFKVKPLKFEVDTFFNQQELFMNRIIEHPILGTMEKQKVVNILVDGKPVEAYEGEMILAALLAKGIRVNRITSKEHKPRGLFCGIGRCTDCAMEVNGVPNVRTCVTEVEDGMIVNTQIGYGEWSESND